jgi:hypothetical protein
MHLLSQFFDDDETLSAGGLSEFLSGLASEDLPSYKTPPDSPKSLDDPDLFEKMSPDPTSLFEAELLGPTELFDEEPPSDPIDLGPASWDEILTDELGYRLRAVRIQAALVQAGFGGFAHGQGGAFPLDAAALMTQLTVYYGEESIAKILATGPTGWVLGAAVRLYLSRTVGKLGPVLSALPQSPDGPSILAQHVAKNIQSSDVPNVEKQLELAAVITPAFLFSSGHFGKFDRKIYALFILNLLKYADWRTEPLEAKIKLNVPLRQIGLVGATDPDSDRPIPDNLDEYLRDITCDYSFGTQQNSIPKVRFLRLLASKTVAYYIFFAKDTATIIEAPLETSRFVDNSFRDAATGRLISAWYMSLSPATTTYIKTGAPKTELGEGKGKGTGKPQGLAVMGHMQDVYLCAVFLLQAILVGKKVDKTVELLEAELVQTYEEGFVPEVLKHYRAKDGSLAGGGGGDGKARRGGERGGRGDGKAGRGGKRGKRGDGKAGLGGGGRGGRAADNWLFTNKATDNWLQKDLYNEWFSYLKNLALPVSWALATQEVVTAIDTKFDKNVIATFVLHFSMIGSYSTGYSAGVQNSITKKTGAGELERTYNWRYRSTFRPMESDKNKYQLTTHAESGEIFELLVTDALVYYRFPSGTVVKAPTGTVSLALPGQTSMKGYNITVSDELRAAWPGAPRPTVMYFANNMASVYVHPVFFLGAILGKDNKYTGDWDALKSAKTP